MGSWIYIIVVVVFAVISRLNKAGKSKSKGPSGGGMPTFGGGSDNPLRGAKRPGDTQDRERQAQKGSGFPVPGNDLPQRNWQTMLSEERQYDASPAFPESAQIPTPDYVTGEGMSLEQPEVRDGVKERTERMQRELERIQASFDGMAGAGSGSSSDNNAYEPQDYHAGSTDQPYFKGNREELRRGLIWAEVLGAPRSKQPHSVRR